MIDLDDDNDRLRLFGFKDWKRKSPDQHRREATEQLAYYLDDPDSPWAKDLRERANWTDEQWEAYDAEIEARIQAEQAEAERKRQAAHRSKLRHDGWPRRALELADAADESKPGIHLLKSWDSSETNIIVLSGLPGCGKTSAAAWWAVRQVGKEILFVRASEFARASRYGDAREKWLNAASLVFDDIGAEFADSKGSFQTDLDELIDVFYGERGRLIMTTNLTAEQFKKRYGERVVDRLRECGTWFAIAGGSLRGKGS